MQPSTYVSDFIFTDDFAQCCQKEYADYCLHILCHSGAAQFCIGDTLFNVIGGDAIIKSSGKPVTDIRTTEDFRIEALLISWKFLSSSTPESSYKTIGAISTMQNPVIPMNESDLARCQGNFRAIRQRLERPYHHFYTEVLRRQVELMIFDFYDIHARHNHTAVEGTKQANRILNRFVGMLQEGLYRQQRSVDYYASRLFISPKYLSECCMKASGHNASYWINQFTNEEIVRLLNDRNKPLTEIAYELHFSSPSYLSRYVRRTLGCSPRTYRQKLR